VEAVQLIGAETVSRAGSNIASAAGDMLRAADTISAAFEQQQRWLDGWLERLDGVLSKQASAPNHSA